MVNAQEWLDRNYPLENRKNIAELDISKKNLEGALSLVGFVNLERLDCLINHLNDLDLNDCCNLKRLNCSGNQLTNLNLTNLTQLEMFWCFSNCLTQINYPVFDPSNYKQLSIININDNNFPSQDLTVFSQFTNLIHLNIGSEDKKRIKQGIYNRFHGSLEPLRNLERLVVLDIRNTDINSGVEYLPPGIRSIQYSYEGRFESKVKEIAWQLSLRESKKQSKWEELGFSLSEIKSWMESGLKADEYDLANRLKNEKNLSPTEAKNNLKRLRSELEDNQFQAQIETPPQKKR